MHMVISGSPEVVVRQTTPSRLSRDQFFEWVLTDAQEMSLKDFRGPARQSVQQDNLQGEILRNAEEEPAG